MAKETPRGVLPFGEFRLVVFEGGDRLGIVAGIKIGGADGVKNWLDLRRHFDAGDERFEIRRGLGVIAGLEFRHRLAVGGREIATVLARGGRDADRAKRRGKGARAPNGGFMARNIAEGLRARRWFLIASSPFCSACARKCDSPAPARRARSRSPEIGENRLTN